MKGAQLLLAGDCPGASLRALEGKGVSVLGLVEDLPALLDSVSVVAVPLRTGAGTRIKILEAMSLGVPVVSTSKGCEGIEVVPGEDLLVEDDPHRFAAAVISVLEDPELADRLGAAGRKCVREKYDPLRIGADAVAVMEKLRGEFAGPGPVSIICTVRNEAAAVGELLDSLDRQSRRPEEIVVVDGGSSDETVGVVRNRQERMENLILIETEGNIACGRNRAVERASHERVISVDSGVTMAADWLMELAAANGPGAWDPVWGPTLAAPKSLFETALAAVTLPDECESGAVTFHSARNLAFTKTAWRRAGGFPEWLDYGEDALFDIRLRSFGCRHRYSPEAAVYYRPRRNLREFVLQYYRYAGGDGRAGLLFRRHLVRYAAYAALLFSVARGGPPEWAACLAGSVWYMRRPVQRYRASIRKAGEGMTTSRSIQGFVLLPLLRLAGDLAKMAGYPMGALFRLRGGDGGET